MTVWWGEASNNTAASLASNQDLAAILSGFVPADIRAATRAKILLGFNQLQEAEHGGLVCR